MKNGIHFKSLVLGATLGAAIVFSVAAADPAAPWDYKTFDGAVFGTSSSRLDEAINQQVAEGWEFVSASHVTEHWGFAVLRRKGNED